MKQLFTLCTLSALLLIPAAGSAETIYSHVAVTSGVDSPGNITGAPDGAATTFSSTSGWLEPGFPQESSGDVVMQYIVDSADLYSMTVWFMNGASIEHTSLIAFYAPSTTGTETISNLNNVTFDRIRIMPDEPLFGVDSVWIDIAAEEPEDTTPVDTTPVDLPDEPDAPSDNPVVIDEPIEETSHAETSTRHSTYPRLVKLVSDGDPSTQYDTAVYAIDDHGKRRPFSGESTYFSWFEDFDEVVELSPSAMAAYSLGATMPMHHGTWLVKIQSVNDVYAVERGGVLRRIPDEATAELFYGADWADRVRDISPTDWPRYTLGDDLSSSAHPNEFVVRDDNLVVWHVRDGVRRQIPETDLAVHGIQGDHIVSYNAFETFTDAADNLLESYSTGILYTDTDDFDWYSF
ncbi:MAG TPA: hypothetical protein QF873_00365 [Patescibacteria group bacterium]|nr:hypothetical protein [Patescibacteria group bacterium]